MEASLELPSVVQFQALPENAQKNVVFELLERLEDCHPDYMRYVVCPLYRSGTMTLYDILISWATLGKNAIW